MALPALGWIDWLLLGVLAVSVLLGLARGFVFEAMALAGWVVAWFAAQWAAPFVAPWLPLAAPDSPLALAAGFVVAFGAVVIVWSLLARLVRLLVRATPLTFADRMLGAGFGFARGAVVLLALATAVEHTPAAQSSLWRASAGASMLGAALRGLKPLVPPAIARRLPA
jgi:membrane protein required for colicin V production